MAQRCCKGASRLRDGQALRGAAPKPASHVITAAVVSDGRTGAVKRPGVTIQPPASAWRRDHELSD